MQYGMCFHVDAAGNVWKIDRRGAADLFRARIKRAASQHERTSIAVHILACRMRIRMIKSPPAPIMDGFDVRDMVAEQIRDVDGPTANYLVIAGYAVRIRAHDNCALDMNRGLPRDQRSDNPQPDSDFQSASRWSGNGMSAEPHVNGRAPFRAELSGPRRGGGQEQSRPEKAANERQIAEPMEE